MVVVYPAPATIFRLLECFFIHFFRLLALQCLSNSKMELLISVRQRFYKSLPYFSQCYLSCVIPRTATFYSCAGI
jgi:hypothetical protein